MDSKRFCQGKTGFGSSAKAIGLRKSHSWNFGASVRLMCDVAGNIMQVMNSATKLLEAMSRNPLDWRLEQLQAVARRYHIEWRHDGTNHCVFIRADGATLPVPARRPIKPVYVKKFVVLIEGA